jgi:MYXO-CTERM domain-containing protein
LAVIVGLVAMPWTARASFEDFLLFVLFNGPPPKVDARNPAGCAIQITVKTLVSDMTNGQEKIIVGGTTLATLNTVSGLKQGDRLLFASNAFKNETGITPDGTINEADCGKIAANAAVKIQGSFMDLANFTVPSGFMAGQAVTVADKAASPMLVNTATTAVALQNRAGQMVSVGGPATANPDMAGGAPADMTMGGGGGGGGGGGCDVTTGAQASGAALLAFGLLVLFLRRRSRV